MEAAIKSDSDPREDRLAPAIQEFPGDPPSVLSVEKTALDSLVHHRCSVDQDLSLEELEKEFRDRRVDFIALVRDGRVTGICARVRLGALLGSRYGFALYGRSPAHIAQVKTALIFTVTTPVRIVLDRALARSATDFHEDVVLTGAEGQLVGLIPVEALAHLQSRLVGEQLAELERQRETLRQQNLDLFQTNHALRQAEGLYQGLFESNTLGVALLDLDGNIRQSNRRLAELLTLGDGPMGSISDWMGEWDRLRFTQLLTAREQGESSLNRSERHEFVLNLPVRGPRLFRFATGWIPETGQICACLDDITEQRALERNLSRQEKQSLLDTLVGGIAHELNNKLTPVIGFAEMLRSQMGGEFREHAGLISQSAQEASRIIRQLLQLSKPETGNPRRLDLRAVVDEALLMLKFQVREMGCALKTSFGPEPVVVLADAAQIKQVVINLVLNALHAMEGVPAPMLKLTVRQSAGSAHLEVADNGAGISAANLRRIFDPFFTTKGPDQGTGLGLSICLSVAREYNGDITVQSEPGFGAVFTLTLPVALGGVEAEPGSIPKARKEKDPAARVVKILVAEDEDVVGMVLQEMLRTSFKCQVHVAANGAEALALADRHAFDLVISDIRMPVMAGTELYLRLREIQPLLARRFAFITGHPGEKSLQEEIARWDVPVLAKPFESSRLVEVCRPLLDRIDSDGSKN